MTLCGLEVRTLQTKQTHKCRTVLQTLGADQRRFEVGQFLGGQDGLTERRVKAACDAAALARLIAERHLDTMHDQRTPGAVHASTVLRVQLLERLHEQHATLSLHLHNNAIIDNRLLTRRATQNE